MKKNRTVKELNIDFEELLERFKMLEENDMKDKRNSEENECKEFKEIIQEYDEKIKLLAKRLDESIKNNDSDMLVVENFKCQQCEKTFKKKPNLR